MHLSSPDEPFVLVVYQALYGHYLDNIMIYSNDLEGHVKHVKSVLDILIREKLYLSRSKLHFIASKLKILGCVTDNKGIQMDAENVDSVLNWKVPTN